jgi:predicted lactoylglutathione lyase
MRHEARQVPSWLIFDVSQKMKPALRPQVECTIPVLPVSSLARSIRFYTTKLGFRLDWRGNVVCSVSRDGRSIMLRQKSGREKSAPVWVWIGLRSDRLFKSVRAKRVKVIQEPQNHSWAYDMMFSDPDGNVLWLGTETKRDLPLDD